MPMKCYNKPNRRYPRYFSACDAARVADNARSDNNLHPGTVVSTVGARLGYPILIDGSKFAQEEVQKEIEEIIDILDKAGTLALLIPGSLIWKTVLFVIRRFTSKFAILIAPVVAALLLKHKLPEPINCKK